MFQAFCFSASLAALATPAVSHALIYFATEQVITPATCEPIAGTGVSREETGRILNTNTGGSVVVSCPVPSWSGLRVERANALKATFYKARASYEASALACFTTITGTFESCSDLGATTGGRIGVTTLTVGQASLFPRLCNASDVCPASFGQIELTIPRALRNADGSTTASALNGLVVGYL